MEELKEEKQIELRSEEVQEIMGQVPPWIQRWGITVMAFLMVLFLGISWFFKFPQSLNAQVTLTTATPPAELHARSSGQLDFVAVKDKERVEAGTVLAVIRNTANFRDMSELATLYHNWKSGKITVDSMWVFLERKEWQAGEWQSVFLAFKQSLENYLNYQKRNYYPRKIALKKEERARRMDMEHHKREEMMLGEKQAEVARKIYLRDSVLFSKQIGSEESYDEALQAYLQSRRSVLDNMLNQKEMSMQRLQEKETELDLEHQYEETASTCRQALWAAGEQLEAQLKAWEQAYVLRSPITGNVNLMGIWSSNQHVAAGELVFIVLPEKPDAPIGKALLPAAGAGKVEKGQRVNVRLNNFPDKEYGFLVGRVKGVSDIPDEESNYFVEIEFPKGLTTNYKRKLPMSKQMVGTAQIIIKDKRLIETFVEPVSKIIREHR
mgnify:FL=1